MALVNYENVVAAAEALIADGQKASVRKVIDRLGGGSPNAVLKFLGEYKAGRPVIRLNDVDLDPAIVSAIKRQMQTVAADATTAAEERASSLNDDLQTLAETSQAAEQQIEQLTADLAAANEQVQALATAKSMIEDKASRENELAQAKIAELTKDLHDERQRSAGAQIELGKLQAMADAVPGLEAQVERLQGELKAEGAGRAAAEQRAAVADAQVKLINDQVAKAATDLEKADQAHKEAVAQIRQESAAAGQEHKAALAQVRTDLDAAHHDVKTARDEARKAEAKHGDELKQVRKELDAARDQAAELRGQLTELKTVVQVAANATSIEKE